MSQYAGLHTQHLPTADRWLLTSISSAVLYMPEWYKYIKLFC
jgi:hypothetical protein